MQDKKETQADAHIGFGAMIRLAREEKGISMGDLQTRSRISIAQLQALENENMDALPEPVYIRAFLRTIARVLDLDAKVLTDDYTVRFAQHSGPVLMSAPETEDVQLMNAKPSGRIRLSWVVVLLFLIILGAGGYFYLNMNESEKALATQDATPTQTEGVDDAASTATTPEAGVATKGAASDADAKASTATPTATPIATTGTPADTSSATPSVTPPTATSTSNAQGNVSTQEAAAQETKSSTATAGAGSPATANASAGEPAGREAATATAASPQPTVTTPQPTPATPLVLVMQTGKDACWIEVKNAQGQVVFTQEVPPQQTRTVSTTWGARMVLGNAQNVKVLANGKPYPLPVPVRNGVVSLTIAAPK